MIREIRREDKSLVVDILSAAFRDNKSVNFVSKQDNYQVQRRQRLMEYVFESCYKYDVSMVDPENKAVALAIYPHQKINSAIKSIMLDLFLALQVIGINRIRSVMKREAYIKKQHPYSEFIYFWFLGVDPMNQVKGAGSLLLDELKAKANKKKLPICLETSTVRNLPLYKKHGFTIYHEWESELTGFKLYFLKYEPA